MIGDELGEKVVSVTFTAAKGLTVKALKAMARIFLKGAKKSKQFLFPAKKKMNMNKLDREGNQLQGVEVEKLEIAGFNKYMKKYGVDYSLVRHKNDPTKYSLFFKAKDMSKLESAMKDFTNDITLDNDSLKEKVAKAREEAFNANKTRQQEREKSKTKTKSKGQER